LDGLCTYDESTINQWQKDDAVYTQVLNEVCQGKLSKETSGLLNQGMMSKSVTETFLQLNEADFSFPNM